MGLDERKPRQSQYGSVDPAPPSSEGNVSHWSQALQNESLPMFERMRAVFSLRNERSDEACLALCKGFISSSALLRHELAYVLGQMQNPVCLPTLTERLVDPNEHVMVRHEAAEAMGAIGDRSIIPVLERFTKHPLPEVSESCIVALDLLAWVSGSEFETAEW
ncbi:MAG: HEAT repeat domain-containing protein [Candidatus Poseidonia sp.]|uniref:HEAT repeat domain-containing protein n=1 Tax=Poseidonia sp. TaxID=2666344 RepID=UPI0030C5C45A|nr:HEAT repeat domain-containing protein [Poseidonia sp.]